MSTLTTGEAQMSDGQQNYIEMLLDRKWVPSVVAGRIIELLEELPEAGANGLENMQERRDLPNT